MKLTQTLIVGSVVIATTGMVSATPTPTELDTVVSQAPRGLGMDEWVGEIIEAEIGELERLRLEVGGDVGTEVMEGEEGVERNEDGDLDEKDGEDGDEGDEDEDDEPEEPEEPKHPKHPKDDKHKHKHGKGKGEKKHKHKGGKHGHEHEHRPKHGKHRDGPPRGPPPHGPPHGPPPHGPPSHGPHRGGPGEPHGGPPHHHPHGPPPPPPSGPPGRGHKDEGHRPPHHHHETGGPEDEEQMDDYFRLEDQEDRDSSYGEAGDEDVHQPSGGPFDGERVSARQRHHHHEHHHVNGMTRPGRGQHGLEHGRGFFHQLSASLTEFKPFEAMVLVVTFTLGLISMMKTAIMLFFFAKRGGRGGKRGWMKHMGVRGGGRHGPSHKRGMGRGGRGGRKSGSGSSGGSGSEDEGTNLLVVVDEKYRDEKA